MNRKATRVALTMTLLAGIAPALATADDDPLPAAQETRAQAESAVREAVRETLERMRADARSDLALAPARPEPKSASGD